MNSTDLKGLFAKYVTDYKVGVDDVITKHVGEYQESSGGVEAELDIQYIMGVSPGIQTEFWEFPGQDFGADLNMWTSNLTSQDDIPIVHSVSYGWQGNLSQINVKQSDVDAVDANFAKLAAKGISIMISSGDSGSGYSSEDSTCDKPNGGATAGVGIDGTVASTGPAFNIEECCSQSQQGSGKGWTFVPHQKEQTASVGVVQTTFVKPAPDNNGKNGSFHFDNKQYHVENAQGGKVFTDRDLWTLNGAVNFKSGGVVVAKSPNVTGSHPVTFSACKTDPKEPVTRCAVSAKFAGGKITGTAFFFAPGSTMPAECFNIDWENNGIWEQGGNPPPPPPPGTCTVYSSVTSKTSANSTTFSGFPASGPKAPPLWASCE